MPKAPLQPWLPDENEYEQFVPALQDRHEVDLVKQLDREFVCLVNHHNREGSQRLERPQEIIERIAELRSAGISQGAAAKAVCRDDAELDE